MDNTHDIVSYDEFNINFVVEEDIPVIQHELSIFNYEFVGNRTTCSLNTVDKTRVLSYKIPATLPLEQFFRKQLYKGEFLTILSSIMNQLMFFEENGLPIKKALLDTKYMYIELYTLDIQVVYLPIEKAFSDFNFTLFIQNFISGIRFADMNSVECVEKILNYLDSRKMFSFVEFYNFILELTKENIESDIKAENENKEDKKIIGGNVAYNNPLPYLVRLKTNELISISKDIFNLGKAPDNDYQIVDNKKISRYHATFKISNGECYIKDNNSTNHIYINGKLIQPGFDVMLENDDYIRLGNEEFKYWVK